MLPLHRRRRIGLLGAACSVAIATGALAAVDSPPPVAMSDALQDVVSRPPVLSETARVAILHDLRSLATTGTVLHVGAHPDDENTQLIAWLSRGRGFRTGYLSVTRGDGGQNELGRDFDEKLGVARTQELLAARRLDGGSQFFTRAIDFGYTKSPEETLRIWVHDAVLSDVVRVIRRFRPDVIITRFPVPPGSGGHGQHTASAILAVEAFKLAGDPNAYPDQIAEGLAPWQPTRVLWNAWGDPTQSGLDGPVITEDIGGEDTVAGESFASIANESRAMHKTQGLGGFAGRGGGGPNPQSFMLLAGEPAESDIMDGVDTSWSRIPGGAEVGPMVGELTAGFDATNPGKSVPALLAIRARIAALDGADPLLAEKRKEVDRILQACLAIKVDSVADRPEAVPGETIKLTSHRVNRVAIPGRFVSRRILVNGRVVEEFSMSGGAGGTTPIGEEMTTDSVHIPENAALTQPYWLREEGSAGIARVDDPSLIGYPEGPPEIEVQFVMNIAGREMTVSAIPTYASGKSQAPVTLVPPVSIDFDSDVYVIVPNATKEVTVRVTAARESVQGDIRLDAPEGWKVRPHGHHFDLDGDSGSAAFTFDVTAPPKSGPGRLSAVATVGGHEYSNKRQEIRYSHIPVQLLQPPARVRLASFDLETRAHNVGYLPGAGDSVADCLAQMGCKVRELTGADLTPESLAGLDAVVIGVRAFNEREDLADAFPGLLAWVEAGGTVVAQYNRPNRLKATQLGPYPISIEGSAPALRVTDETAPVTILAPESPALNTPNKITAADFEGWVQERGAYFPSSWDTEHYQTLFAMSDPGEKQPDSSILVAHYGKGYYVYTGLGFFRQLPAGVPGAYRLMANLISLGK